jgi:uncharacterized protein with PIN domain
MMTFKLSLQIALQKMTYGDCIFNDCNQQAINMKPEYTAEFRFYEELNDFLPPEQRKQTTRYCFSGHPGIKDPIEVFGVPHTEVELIIVNNQPVGFDYQLQAGDRVSVYPVFKSLDISPLPRLRETPWGNPRFILDVNLGKLAKRMRLLGFDCLYRNDYQDAEVVNIAVNDQRIVLTRDRRLLYIKYISHGYWVRAVDVENQINEVLHRFHLHNSIHPFVRCLVCNGVLAPVAKADILDRLEPKTRLYYDVFHRCKDCQRIYWEGKHMEHMRQCIAGITTYRNRSCDVSNHFFNNDL